MKPGATTWPVASITREAAPSRRGPMAATRSPSTATSAGCRGEPLPSMRVPPRISRDQTTLLLHDGDRGHSIALLDPVHVLHTVHDLAEHRVVTIEMGRGAIADVELAACGVGMLAAGHGHRAPHVLQLVEFGLDGIAGPPAGIALGIAALDDEVRHHPVKGQSIVEAFLGQGHEVLDGLGGILGEELYADFATLLERDDGRLFHWRLLSSRA